MRSDEADPKHTISVGVQNADDKGNKAVLLHFPTAGYNILAPAARELCKAFIDALAYPDGAIRSLEPVLFVKLVEPPIEIWLQHNPTLRCKAITLVLPNYRFTASYIAFAALVSLLTNALAYPDNQCMSQAISCGRMTFLTGNPEQGAPKVALAPFPTMA